MRLVKNRPTCSSVNAQDFDVRRDGESKPVALVFTAYRGVVNFRLTADEARHLAYLLEQGADMLDGMVVEKDNDHYVVETQKAQDVVANSRNSVYRRALRVFHQIIDSRLA